MLTLLRTYFLQLEYCKSGLFVFWRQILWLVLIHHQILSLGSFYSPQKTKLTASLYYFQIWRLARSSNVRFFNWVLAIAQLVKMLVRLKADFTVVQENLWTRQGWRPWYWHHWPEQTRHEFYFPQIVLWTEAHVYGDGVKYLCSSYSFVQLETKRPATKFYAESLLTKGATLDWVPNSKVKFSPKEQRPNSTYDKSALGILQLMDRWTVRDIRWLHQYSLGNQVRVAMLCGPDG